MGPTLNVSYIFLGPPTEKGGASKMYHYIFEVPKYNGKKHVIRTFEGGGYTQYVSYI